MCGFLGVNGAGKTTSLKIMLKFIKPDHGEVKFHSEMGETDRDIFSQIGYMPERPYFYPDLTGKEFLTYMGTLSKLDCATNNRQIEKWSNEINISYALGRKIRTYSKGMLQRLGFVASLLHEPKLIVLDEPMAGLDPIGRREFKIVFKKLNKEGRSIFFSSHIVNDIEEICDDVVVIDKGKLFYSGRMQDLLEKYSSGSFLVKYEKNGELKEFEGHYSECLNVVSGIVNNESDRLVSFERKLISLEEIVYRV
ncbi:MAG: hypothetical protein OHK0056_04220 [Bacteriovoracaceae bacterium]